MRTKEGKIYRAIEETEVPPVFEELHFERDGSLKVKVYGPSKKVLQKLTSSLRNHFYSKPNINDVGNAIIALAEQIPLDELADAVEALKRRKPNPPVKQA